MRYAYNDGYIPLYSQPNFRYKYRLDKVSSLGFLLKCTIPVLQDFEQVQSLFRLGALNLFRPRNVGKIEAVRVSFSS